MNKFFKKVLVSTCALSLMAFPVIAEAKESNVPADLSYEVIPEDQNGIMPLYADSTGYVVQNGETKYFVNKENGLPFYILAGFGMQQTYYFEGNIKNVEIGIVDENNNVVESFFQKDETWSFGVSFPTIKESGRYKMYLTNYSEDPVIINNIEMFLFNYNK